MDSRRRTLVLVFWCSFFVHRPVSPMSLFSGLSPDRGHKTIVEALNRLAKSLAQLPGVASVALQGVHGTRRTLYVELERASEDRPD